MNGECNHIGLFSRNPKKLIQFYTEKKITPAAGYNHWGLDVEDKNSFIRELEKKGVPLLNLEGTGRFIYFVKDPEGNTIEIYEKQAKK